MTKKIPILISRGSIVFPHSYIALEIGRERTINAVESAIKDSKSVVILVSQKNYEVDVPIKSDIYTVGTLCDVKVVSKHDDRSLTVELIGHQRVALVDPSLEEVSIEGKHKKAWFAGYEVLKEKNASVSKNKPLLEKLIEHVGPITLDSKLTFNNINEMLKQDLKPAMIVDIIANFWPSSQTTSINFKQPWLEELDVNKRIKLILDTNYLSDDIKEELNNTITKKVNKNISTQQKEFYLREKLRVIKEELGEAASKEVEIQKFKTWLKNTDAPERIKIKVKEEINKLEISSSMSSEAMVIKAYLDWIMAIPWTKCSEDEISFDNIRKTLDASHNGLKKVKERVLEFIAVQKRTQQQTGTIVCFVGPPGVGKTSMAQSIAKSLNKAYVKIALGGVSDESEIRGHRKTYVGSMPGKIIKALKKAKVKNPLILLDEIDKLTTSYHGDPVSALLEVLDPKQNNEFADNYIEEDVDLSKVMFIATANYEDNIPEPLLDRLEIIRLSSYTELEKLDIAINNIVPVVLKEHGLTPAQLTFSKSAILLMIQKYTRESGVRGLNQQISTVARKVVMKMEENKLDKVAIDEKNVKDYLLREVYSYTIKDQVSIPGIVNGMAYTEFGGDLLPIEVNYHSGKGNMSLTGNLKDTMKESANVALSYIRANEKTFSLKKIPWSDIDINLHVPAGGIPKDGPSAGITITTALLSAFLDVPVPSNIAMTGEITLRGKVLPIGGLREKVISAARGGVDTIFYPKECEKYLDDIPKEVLKTVKLHPIVHYSEIYKYLFK